MEVISRLIKVQLPNYLRSLPIPASLGGFAQLSGGEWIQLVPFVVTTSVVIYVVVSSTRDALLPKAPEDPKASFVNKDIQKDKDKVANVIDVEDLGEKTAYCRCWKSKKVNNVSCTPCDNIWYSSQASLFYLTSGAESFIAKHSVHKSCMLYIPPQQSARLLSRPIFIEPSILAIAHTSIPCPMFPEPFLWHGETWRACWIM